MFIKSYSDFLKSYDYVFSICVNDQNAHWSTEAMSNFRRKFKKIKER